MDGNETLTMSYYRMPVTEYEDLRSNCCEEASYLKRGYVGEDGEWEPVDQKYPSDVVGYLKSFLHGG